MQQTVKSSSSRIKKKKMRRGEASYLLFLQGVKKRKGSASAVPMYTNAALHYSIVRLMLFPARNLQSCETLILSQNMVANVDKYMEFKTQFFYLIFSSTFSLLIRTGLAASLTNHPAKWIMVSYRLHLCDADIRKIVIIIIIITIIVMVICVCCYTGGMYREI